MGCTTSTVVKAGSVEDRLASKQIESQLHKDKSARKKALKLLLLGAGESGKSTVCKQVRKLHCHEFSQLELHNFKNQIYVNIFQSLAIVTQSLAVKGLKLQDPELQNTAKLFVNVYDIMQMNEELFFKVTPSALQKLWQDPNVQEEVTCSKAEIPENIGYFFDNLERILQSNYVPSFEDCLRVRSRTTGIVEVRFKMNDFDVILVDVGGQRTERRKWIHCFDDVTAIIFCAALSEYDQVLMEDHCVNRLAESLTLFEQAINVGWFAKSSFILFLNKSDVFERKIKKVPLKTCFPDYKAEPTYEAGVKYIESKFMERNRAGRPFFSHVTCATSTENMKFVMKAIKETLIAKYMEAYNM